MHQLLMKSQENSRIGARRGTERSRRISMSSHGRLPSKAVPVSSFISRKHLSGIYAERNPDEIGCQPISR